MFYVIIGYVVQYWTKGISIFGFREGLAEWVYQLAMLWSA